MTLVTSQSAAVAAFDARSLLRLPTDLRLTPEQFEQVCAGNREAVLELAADGLVIWMPPVGGETSLRNGALTFQLGQFARHSGDWIAFASCAGFHLPDGSVLSPDASLVRLDRWQALSPQKRRSFPPLCPDLVVELASPSDEGPRGLTALRRKMAAYQTNGFPPRLAAAAPRVRCGGVARQWRAPAPGAAGVAGRWNRVSRAALGAGRDLGGLNPVSRRGGPPGQREKRRR